MMTEKKKTNLEQNFTLSPDGKIIKKNGDEIKPRVGIKPILTPEKDKKNNSAPEKKSKKRMRWYKNSFLTDQQVTDEQKQIDDHIA